jgi:heptosyltransferase-2
LLKTSDPQNGVLLFGGPEEEDFNLEIKKETGDLIVDAGCSNSLLRFSALIDLVDILCTPDSLGLHIAVALKKTAVVLVGPTSPWELDVFGNGDIIYSDKCDCISCYRPNCPKEINCMNTIEPGRVFVAINKYL